MNIMYHFSSFIILFYNIVQENGKSPTGPEEGSRKMERNPGAGPENQGAILETETSPGTTQEREERLTTLAEVDSPVLRTVPERRLEGLHAPSPRTSRDTPMQCEYQNGKFIIEEVPTSSAK